MNGILWPHTRRSWSAGVFVPIRFDQTVDYDEEWDSSHNPSAFTHALVGKSREEALAFLKLQRVAHLEELSHDSSHISRLKRMAKRL